MKTLITKELRENAKWLVIGLAIMSLLTFAAVPKQLEDTNNLLTEYLGFAGALFAFGLGLSQSIWDFSDRQKGFLFHRATNTNQVLASKLIAAAIIYALALGIPLLVTAVYFGIVGLDKLPVRPLQVVAPSLMVTLCFLIHPATMLMIKRPARWFGTKILPLVIPITTCILFYAVCNNTWYCWTFLAIAFLLLAVLSWGLFLPSLENLSLALSAPVVVVVLICMGIIPASFLFGPRAGLDHTWDAYGVDDGGTLWRFRYASNLVLANQEYGTNYISGSPVLPDQPANINGTLPEGFHANFTNNGVRLQHQAKKHGSINMVCSLAGKSIFWDARGYFLVYNLRGNRRLSGIVARDGLTSGAAPNIDKFDCPSVPGNYSFGYLPNFYSPLQGNMRNWVVVPDSTGVYLLDQATGSLQTIVDEPVSRYYQVREGIDLSLSFIVETDRRLAHYQIDTGNSNTQDETLSSVAPVVQLVASYPKLPERDVSRWSLAIASNGTLTAFGWVQGYRGKMAKVTAEPNAQWEIYDVADRRTSTVPIGGPIFTGSMPLLLTLTILAITTASYAIQGNLTSLWYDCRVEVTTNLGIASVSAILTVLVSAVCVWYLLRRRGADWRTTLNWLLLTIPLGIATPLALVAIVPKAYFEECPKCDRKRRVDQSKCEHCGSAWEPLASQGIEIQESHGLQSFSVAH